MTEPTADRDETNKWRTESELKKERVWASLPPALKRRLQAEATLEGISLSRHIQYTLIDRESDNNIALMALYEQVVTMSQQIEELQRTVRIILHALEGDSPPQPPKIDS